MCDTIGISHKIDGSALFAKNSDRSPNEPQVVEYLKTPPSRDELQRIAAATGEPLRALLRTKQPEYLEQGLDDPQLSDDQLLDAMLATPVLINRPIVVSAKGARLGRPLERVLEVL